MPAFLLLDKCRTFHGLEGQLLPGGYVKFYEAGTTDPTDVFGERALSTNNGDTIDLDASSRLEHECWGDTADAFFAELYDADDVKQGEISYLELPGGAGQALPVLNEGEFLTGDGSNYLAATILQVPDPTGNTGKILGNDGALPQWIAKPADGEAGTSDIDVDEHGFSVGEYRVTVGSGTGTNVGGRTQTASVTFPVAFASAPDHVVPTVSNSSLSSFGNLPTVQVTTKSATGCTFQFKLSELDDSGSGFDYNGAVLFTYVAFGPKA